MVEPSDPNVCVTYHGDGTGRLNIHNPRHGQKIVQLYEELGISDRITLIDGMDIAGTSPSTGGVIMTYFPDFAESIRTGMPFPYPNACLDELVARCNGSETFNVCMDCALNNEDILWESECTYAAIESLCRTPEEGINLPQGPN